VLVVQRPQGGHTEIGNAYRNSLPQHQSAEQSLFDYAGTSDNIPSSYMLLSSAYYGLQYAPRHTSEGCVPCSEWRATRFSSPFSLHNVQARFVAIARFLRLEIGLKSSFCLRKALSHSCSCLTDLYIYISFFLTFIRLGVTSPVDSPATYPVEW